MKPWQGRFAGRRAWFSGRGPGRGLDVRIVAIRFASWVGVLLVHMTDAFEAPRNMLDLPALLLTSLLALEAAARRGTFLCAQLVEMHCNRQVLEVRQVTAAFAPTNPPQFLLRLSMRRNIVRVDQVAV